MTYIKHDNDFVYLGATHTEATRLGASYVESSRYYKLPINYTSLTELSKELNHPTIATLHAKESEKHELMKHYKRGMIVSGDSGLRPYQLVDAEIIKKYPILAIFNEQRTGKTPTVLKALNGLNRGLIVCPSSLKLNWLREFDTWHDGKAVVVSGSKAKRLKLYASVKDETIIVSYETLRTDIADFVKLFKSFEFLIVDEAHRLRNFKTKQSKALYTIRSLAKRVYPMTGTPGVNHAADVFGIMKLMYPNKYRSYWQFVERYFIIVDGMFGKEIYGIREDRAQEFNEILYANSLQRKRRDVMSWVPKITKRIIELEPTSKQTTLTTQIIKKNVIGDEIIDNPLTKLLRLKQLAVDPVYLGIDEQSPKFAFIMDYLQDNNESVIIFSTMTGALKRLHDAIPGSMLLTGEQSTEEKEFAVNSVQSGDCKVLLANIKAGGTGFTIDKADTIIFLDKSYTPDENDQASDRFVPTNPKAEYGAKQIITLLVKGSVEPKIEKMLEDKIDIIKFVNDYGLEVFFKA